MSAAPVTVGSIAKPFFGCAGGGVGDGCLFCAYSWCIKKRIFPSLFLSLTTAVPPSAPCGCKVPFTVQMSPRRCARNGLSFEVVSSPYAAVATASPILTAVASFGTNPSVGCIDLAFRSDNSKWSHSLDEALCCAEPFIRKKTTMEPAMAMILRFIVVVPEGKWFARLCEGHTLLRCCQGAPRIPPGTPGNGVQAL